MMNVLVAVLFCSFLASANFFQAATANQPIKIFDPQSLFSHYKQVWRNTRLSDAPHANDYPLEGPAPGVRYFTPVTENLIRNGTISKAKVLHMFNSILGNQKRLMYHNIELLDNCWKKTKRESERAPSLPFYCYFFWTSHCKNIYKYRETVKGQTELMMIECLSQYRPILGSFLGNNLTEGTHNFDPPAIHVEAGGGISAGLYFAASSGVAFDIPERKVFKFTYTTCWGVKLDVSFGGGLSVSYLTKISDLLGDALTIEIGLDLPGTEIGFDVLFHYSTSEHRIVGFGFAFGMGIGLSPVDFASSRCHTKLISDFHPASIGIKAGPLEESSWNCDEKYIGVTSKSRHGDRTCCPIINRHEPKCTSAMCWFRGKRCPVAPGTEFKGLKRKRTLSLSSCLGQRLLPGVGSEGLCYKFFKTDPKLKYCVWRHVTKECWISDSFEMSTCVWAPVNGPRSVYLRY